MGDYSEYYKQYYEAHQAQERNPLYGPGSAQVRQDLATPENTLILGAIGAVMGTLAAVGVILNNNNVNSLSKDQDSICKTTKALGNTALTASALGTAATTTAWTATLNTEINKIITAINGIATPTC